MTRPSIPAPVSQLPIRIGVAVTVRARAAVDRERGDVPGWVLVTLMSALIVVGLIGLLKTQLGNAFTRAMNSVTAP